MFETPVPNVDLQFDGADAEPLVGVGEYDGVILDQIIQHPLLEVGEVRLGFDDTGEYALLRWTATD